jgi:hypothetical protein
MTMEISGLPLIELTYSEKSGWLHFLSSAGGRFNAFVQEELATNAALAKAAGIARQ